MATALEALLSRAPVHLQHFLNLPGPRGYRLRSGFIREPALFLVFIVSPYLLPRQCTDVITGVMAEDCTGLPSLTNRTPRHTRP